MNKYIENSARATTNLVCEEQEQENEKQEEIEKDIFQNERRDIVPDDTTTSSTNTKLLTIPEFTNERSNNTKINSLSQSIATLSNLSPNVSLAFSSGTYLKSQRYEAQIPYSANITDESVGQNIIATEVKNISNIANPLDPSSLTNSLKNSTSSKGNPTKSEESFPSFSKILLNSQNLNSNNDIIRDEASESKLSGSAGESNSIGPDNNSSNYHSTIQTTTLTSAIASIVSTNTTISFDKQTKNTSRLSERAKKKSWYNVIYPNYKSRAEDFKKLFKEVPNDERLIVDYSCALQRDILVQGRLYVSQNFVCFHANIFSWETYVSIKWKEVTAITKEKTALVIPNAISISTANEKYFFATFTARDKSFLMLFRVWQNTLMNKQFSTQEIWKYVHNCYGEELGLTTDDEDYIDPTIEPITGYTETDVDFHAVVDDTLNTNSNQNIKRQLQTSGNSSTSSGGSCVRKSKTKAYFFNSSKSSNLHSSANASASGSDNRAGNGYRKQNKKMKSSAKDLTLSSIKPEELLASLNFSTNDIVPSAVSGMERQNPIDSTTINADIKWKISKNNRLREEIANKNSETAPTDVSDSSDSEDNNIPFVATTECTSPHEGRQILHTILPTNVETLFNLLFSKSKFLTDFHINRKSTDLLLGEWSLSNEGQQVRTVNVTVQLAASVGPKASKVTEYQTMRDCSKPGELYSIDINSVNAGIPYADSFSVLMHYCLVRTVDDHTMLSVHAQIKYKKSIWGVVKGFIEKNTWAGLEDHFSALLHALQSETCIPPAKGKGRRRRGTTSQQLRPLEDGSALTAKSKSDVLEASVPMSSSSRVNISQTHVGIKQLLQHQHRELQGSKEQKSTKYKRLSIIVMTMMCCLLVVNIVLLLKLWKLEHHIENDLNKRIHIPNLAALKEIPNRNEDWLKILHKQELLHETELKKWHQVLQTAIELLKKVSVVCEKIYNDGELKQQISNIHYEF